MHSGAQHCGVIVHYIMQQIYQLYTIATLPIVPAQVLERYTACLQIEKWKKEKRLGKKSSWLGKKSS